MKRKLLFLSFCLGVVVFSASLKAATIQDDPLDYFVQRNGNQLEVDGKPFYFSGSNNDHLYHWSHFMIDDMLADAKGLELTVLRIWASSEGQDSLANNGYCFQPNPGEYNEATFQQMDYIIAKAKENDIRLILPLVNNWDDGYGGMPQYVRWCVGNVNDWSGKTILSFDLYNPEDAETADVAIRTGDQWVWHESLTLTLNHGWNYDLSVNLADSTWKTAASGWQYTSPIENLNQVRSFAIGVFGYSHASEVYIDNIRLDAVLYDGLEKKDNWYAADYSYATGVELSSAYISISEGSHSLKMAYSYSYGEYNKAFAEKQLQVDKNDFYTNTSCKQLYKNYLNYFLNRVNTITGKAYKNDPTILMWELANEPRCESDPSGDTLQAWIEEMATYIKSVDANHLVSTGEEGWYKQSDNPNWKYDGSLGADYFRNHQSAFIDICSFHLYPEGYGMSDQENLTWIQEHVDDALNIIGKPVYLGEFGITADRKAKIFNDFDADAQDWSIDWNYAQGPIHVESPSRDGNGAIYYIANINTVNSSCGARIVYSDPGVDYSNYDYLSGWVYIPASAPADLTAEMYTHSGDSWKWTNGQNQVLIPGSWNQVTISKFWIGNGGGDITRLRDLGIQIKRGNTDYYGEVYYDLMGANLKGVYDAAQQISKRNQLYTDWFNLLDVRNANGAAFWQLLAHQDSTTLFPDYWNWGVYYPEDQNTSLIIQDFSLKMKHKGSGSDITPPITTDSGIDGLWHNSPVTFMLVATDAGSGVYETYYSTDGSAPTILYTTPFTISNNGIYTIKYYSLDKAGNAEEIKTAANQAKIDNIAPSGTITINNNADYTKSTSVILNLSAFDVGASGLSQMQFSNDNSIWSSAKAYATTKSWTLTSGDGQKTVYVKFKDVAGNWSEVYSDEIILDATLPIVQITSPKSNSSVSGKINLKASAWDNIAVTKVKFYRDNNIKLGEDTASPYQIKWNTATVTKGYHIIFAKAYDMAGNMRTSAKVKVKVRAGP